MLLCGRAHAAPLLAVALTFALLSAVLRSPLPLETLPSAMLHSSRAPALACQAPSIPPPSMCPAAGSAAECRQRVCGAGWPASARIPAAPRAAMLRWRRRGTNERPDALTMRISYLTEHCYSHLYSTDDCKHTALHTARVPAGPKCGRPASVPHGNRSGA